MLLIYASRCRRARPAAGRRAPFGLAWTS